MANAIIAATAVDAKAITKSDTTVFTKPYDALFVGGAGDVNLVTEAGTTTLFTCVAGQLIPVRTRQVLSTSTDATAIVGLYY